MSEEKTTALQMRIVKLEAENKLLHGVIDRIQGWMEEGHHINLTKQWFDDALRKIDAAMANK